MDKEKLKIEVGDVYLAERHHPTNVQETEVVDMSPFKSMVKIEVLGCIREWVSAEDFAKTIRGKIGRAVYRKKWFKKVREVVNA